RGQHPGQDRHPQQQQREDAEEPVVGDERGLAPAVVVAVLLDHGVREAEHAVPLLYAVGPGDDPVHQRAQVREPHAPALPVPPAPSWPHGGWRRAGGRKAAGRAFRYSRASMAAAWRSRSRYGWPLTSIATRLMVPPVNR